MLLIVISFLAGVLTVLSPCTLPILPIILGGSLAEKNKYRPVIITTALTLSIIIFTLILKETTVLLALPDMLWSLIAGSILILLGFFTIFPETWTHIIVKLGIETTLQKKLNKLGNKPTILNGILIGIILGPIFSSCSPTYGYIISVVIPNNFFIGLLNLLSYALGLALILLLISFLGQAIIKRLKWASNPHGLFRKVVGVLFILIGLLIFFGLDKQLETSLINSSIFQNFNISKIDQRLLEKGANL